MRTCKLSDYQPAYDEIPATVVCPAQFITRSVRLKDATARLKKRIIFEFYADAKRQKLRAQ
jgi:hypothetical protein